MIILGEEQEQAINSLKEFLDDSRLCITLTGSAGSGKTTCMNFFIKHLQEIKKSYSLVATTNKAALVLSKITKDNVNTLHKLLSLSPNIEILNLDLNSLLFVTKGGNLIPNNGLLICDEASMIGDDLFDIVIEKCKAKKCKIIFLADRAQLKPVKHLKLSKVFRIPTINLTKVYRQDSESKLTPLLIELRENSLNNFTESLGENGSILVYNNENNFINQSIQYFKKSIDNKDILNCKLLCYTNAKVLENNRRIRNKLFNFPKEYQQSEILTAYDNYSADKGEIINSMDYIINNKPELSTKKIPYFVDLNGYELSLYDSYEKASYGIFILSNTVSKNHLKALAELIEDARIKAVNTPKMNSRAYSEA